MRVWTYVLIKPIRVPLQLGGWWSALGAFAPDWMLGADEDDAAWYPTQGGRSGAPAPIWGERIRLIVSVQPLPQSHMREPLAA